MAERRKPKETSGDWIESIASKSKRTADDVRRVLERYNIKPRAEIAIPRRLTIRSVVFKGQKSVGAQTPIDFEWMDLGPGLHAILSGRNLRGKTTLLSIMRWCLTGRRSLPSEMKEWFATVNLRFTLDERTYEVRLSDAMKSEGKLIRFDEEREIPVRVFASEDEFEEVMSAFFMSELGLERLTNHTVRDGKSVDQDHDWPWLSTAMTIEPDPGALFGSTPLAAMPLRMMQMFVGMPLVGTRNDLTAVVGRLSHETRQADEMRKRVRTQAEARIAELEKSLEESRKSIESKPSARELRQAVQAANVKYAACEEQLRRLKVLRTAVDADAAAAKESYDRARRELREFKESRDAGFIFRALKPECCPSCDEVITEQHRKKTEEQHVCAVCGTPDRPQAEGAIAAEEERLVEAVGEAKSQWEAQDDRARAAGQDVVDQEGRLLAAERECREAERALEDPQPHLEAERDCIRLEAQIEELRRPVAVAGEAEVDDRDILSAAEIVAKDLMKPDQEAILARVSELTTDYARRFGIENLEKLSIDGATRMKLTKGGQQSYFSAQTAGEKVRLKVAATLAILKIAETEGVGRHPGLLLVDSPGANEMVAPDYEKLIAGLAELATELPHLQIFITGIDKPAIRERVPCSNLRYAEGDEYLW
ncbi:AAA family ATPase [Bradyrhizobium guangdongense]|uniref:Uncharacterized protein n=1 Tax=Bradyrhizobium guangdongense TaxID=1325090 RepID=A0AA88B9Q7_9BRAD|nr:AAA family ATPase [Bradyrhizobium guangdongense]QOZ57889.1 hypothetical protein XH86_03315 [Bradyrhizobium guangdongense]GGI27862.1 hypothetical protein GCM10010987_46510 [Bradyrhizobium guangdongense]